MNNINKQLQLKLGDYMNCNLVIEKGKVTVQPTISLCEVGLKDGLNLSLGIVDNNKTSPLNFGLYFKPTFIHTFTESTNKIIVKDLFDNSSTYHLVNSTEQIYYSYQLDKRLKKETSNDTYTFIGEKGSSVTLTQNFITNNNFYQYSNFKGSSKFALSSNGISDIRLFSAPFTGARANFIKNSDGLITKIEVFNVKCTYSASDKKEIIDFYYTSGIISSIVFSHIDGTTDTYHFNFTNQKWVFSHEESSKLLQFYFDNSKCVTSFGEDEIYQNRANFLNNIEIGSDFVAINGPNNKFAYVHFDNNGNNDYEFNDKGIISFRKFNSYLDDYLIETKSNPFYFGKSIKKYKNLAPYPSPISNNVWVFQKEKSGTMINFVLGLDLPYFNVFFPSAIHRVNVDASETNAKLVGTINDISPNKHYVFSCMFKSEVAGSSSTFSIKFIPYYNGNPLSNFISKAYSTTPSESFNYICEEVNFDYEIDKIVVEINFAGGQKILLENILFTERSYGEKYYRDNNHLIYKIEKNNKVIRSKKHDFEIKYLEFDKTNLFFEESENNNEYIDNIRLSQHFTKQITRDFFNNVIQETLIYKKGNDVEKMTEENFCDNYNLISHKRNYGDLVTSYEYYFNTDLPVEISIGDLETKYNYTNKKIVTSFNLKNNSNIIYSTENNINVDTSVNSISEVGQTPVNFTYNFMKNLTNCSIGNAPLEINSYIEGSSSAKENLTSKTVNNQRFDNVYNSDDLIIESKHIDSNEKILFEYDSLNNIEKVTNFDESTYSYNYGENNECNGEQYNNHKIERIYDGESEIRKSYLYDNENYSNVIKEEGDNTNSEIVNNILAKLSESNHYVCFFDRTLDFTNSQNSDYYNNERFCSLVRKYYTQNNFVNMEYVTTRDNLPIIRTGNGLTFGIVDDHQPIFYEKFVNKINNGYSGSIGCLYDMLNDAFNLCIASIEIGSDYLIKVVSKHTDYTTIKIQLIYKPNNNIITEFDTHEIVGTGIVLYFNVNFQLLPNQIRIHYYSREMNKTFIYSGSFSTPNNLYLRYNFNELPKYFSESKYLKIAAVLADFSFNIPLKDVIEHFDLAYRAYLLSTTLDENSDYITGSKLKFNYPKISDQITWLSLKNTLTDSKKNVPLNYVGKENIFGYEGEELGNCYYSYGRPLLYKTNLSSRGTISFRSKICSLIGFEQTYFTLYNSNISLRLYVDNTGNLKISINGESSQTITNVEALLKKPHLIQFQYTLSNGSLSYTLRFNDLTINKNLNFTPLTTFDTSDFMLLIGANNLEQNIIDINGQSAKRKTNLFMGFFADFMYYSSEDVNIPIFEFEESNNPIICYSNNDVFGRKNSSRIRHDHKNIIYKKYEYLRNGLETTPLITEEKVLINDSTGNFDSLLDRKYLYSYQNSNNTALKYKNIYKYEEQNTVSDNSASITYVREYDYFEGTNFIKSETIKKGSINDGTFTEDKKWVNNYTYENNNLKSISTSIDDVYSSTNSFAFSSSYPYLITVNNSNSFVYENLYLKQIKNYMGQIVKTFDYRGTKLIRYEEPLENKIITFDYDYNGRRIKKNNTSTNDNIEYFYDEKLLIKEKHSGYSLNFIYNEDNSIIGFEYVNANTNAKIKYFYLKNLFGDIVEIINENGVSFVHYLYDAYGNILEIIDNSTNNLSQINPYRYRGYYYDKETQLYWVSSRYYSPELCRWISPDSIEYLDPESINGLNLYAYCGNDPINKYDPTGHFPWLILAAVLLFTPVGGTALQVVASVLSYVGLAIASIFDEDIRNDMNAIGWNPFNTDESATLNSSKVSFYKGVPVFRTAGGRSGSFGAIFLTKDSGVDILRHERGHNWQLMMMGIANYGLMIGLPSLCEWSDRSYYKRPWEITADVFGGVTGRIHSQADINRGYWYLGVSSLLGPLGYLFLFGEY